MRFSSFYTSANTANTLSPFAKEGGEHFFANPEHDKGSQNVVEDERPFAQQEAEEEGVEAGDATSGSPWGNVYNNNSESNSSGDIAEDGMFADEPMLGIGNTPMNVTEAVVPGSNGLMPGNAANQPLIGNASMGKPGQPMMGHAGMGMMSGGTGIGNTIAKMPGVNPGSDILGAQGANPATDLMGGEISNIPGGNDAQTPGAIPGLAGNKAKAGNASSALPGIENAAGGASPALTGLEGAMGKAPAALTGAGSGNEAATAEEGTASNTEGVSATENGSATPEEASGTEGATGTEGSTSQDSTTQGASSEEGTTAPANFANDSTPSDIPHSQASTDSMDRINGGRDAIFKPTILSQAALINADSDQTEISIMQLASERRNRVTGLFAGSRETLVAAIEGNALAVQEVILNQETAVMTTAMDAIASVQNMITQATASAQALIESYRVAINNIITNVTQTVQDGVNSVASEITGLIDSISLPDLPGVETARSMVVSLINSAAGTVNYALSGVLEIISSVFNIGVAMLSAFVGIFGAMVSQAFTLVSNAIMAMLSMLIAILNAVMNLVVNALRNLLYNTILPIVDQIEQRVLQQITTSEEQHLKEVRNNRDSHLEMLANILNPEGAAGGTGGGTGAGSGSGSAAGADPGWTIEKIGESAVNNNKGLLNNFIKVLDRIFGNIIADITTAVMRIVAEVSTRVTQFIMSIINMIIELVQLIAALVEAVVQFVAMIIAELISALSGLLTFITNMLNDPVTTVVSAARGILSRVRNIISSIVSNFLSQIGLGSAPSVPAPVIGPGSGGVTPAFAGGPILIIGGKIIIIIGASFIILSKTAVIIILVLFLILVLVILYLLYKWLNPPVTPPPPPPPPPPPRGNEYSPGLPLKEDNSIPLTKTDIQVSKGEKMIFGFWGEDKDQIRPIGTPAWTDIPGPGPFEVDWEISGDADLFTPGSGIKGFTDPAKDSVNLDVFVDSAWTGNPLKMTATFRDNALPAAPPDIGTTKDTSEVVIEWTMKPRTNPCPTSLNRIAGPGGTWVTAPGIYTYKGEPQLPPPGTPSYENQTVLETLHVPTALNFTMADLKPQWKAANPTINTPDKVAAFLWPTSANGTFVFDNKDSITDEHNGFGTVDPFLPAALNRPTGVGYTKNQDYSCDSTVIGSAVIDRRYSTVNGVEIRKTGP